MQKKLKENEQKINDQKLNENEIKIKITQLNYEIEKHKASIEQNEKSIDKIDEFLIKKGDELENNKLIVDQLQIKRDNIYQSIQQKHCEYQ